MAVQYLGDKKRRLCEQALGEPIRVAVTRGGWKHYVAECWAATGRYWVNWRTGNWEPAQYHHCGTRISTTPPP